MAGYIRRRGKASWEVTVELGKDPSSGRRRRSSVAIRGNKADAERKLRDLQAAVEGGLPVENSKATVAEFLDRWHTSYVVPNTRPRTAESYEVIIRRRLNPSPGRYRLSRLVPASIQEMLAQMLASGSSQRTALHVYRVLFQALRHAVKWGLLPRNPAEAVDPPRAPTREIEVPELDAVLAILELSRKTPYYAAFYFLTATGVRRGEVLGLRWRDLDLDGALCSIVQTVHRVREQGLVIQPPKSPRSRRAIVLDPETVRTLRAHRAAQAQQRLRTGRAYRDQGLVFAGPSGGPLDPSVITHTFRKLAKRAGYPSVRLHDLRHFHATVLLRVGTHPKIVQERLGHSTISMTLDTYSHVVPSMQEAAAEAFEKLMARGRRAVKARDEPSP